MSNKQLIQNTMSNLTKELVLDNKVRVFTATKMAEITKKQKMHVIRDIKDEVKSVFGVEVAQSNDSQDDPNLDDAVCQLFTFSFDNRGYVSEVFMTEKGWLQMGARYDAKTRFAIIDYMDKLKAENKVLKHNAVNVLIERLDSGERKILKRFISDTISASSCIGLISAVKELNKQTIGKNYREWLLSNLVSSFNNYTESLSVKEYKAIQNEAVSVSLELTHMLKNFLALSRGQQGRQYVRDQEYIIASAENSLNKYKPKYYCGSIRIEEESGEPCYIADDDEVIFEIGAAMFTDKVSGKQVKFMSGEVHIKDLNLTLYVSGGVGKKVFENKVSGLFEIKYKAIIEVDPTELEYAISIIPLNQDN